MLCLGKKEMRISYCSCEDPHQILMRHGLFAFSPIRPETAMSIALLDFYRCLFERSADAVHAWAAALHTHYRRGGFRIQDRVCGPVVGAIAKDTRETQDPFRKGLSEAIQWLDALRIHCEQDLDNVISYAADCTKGSHAPIDSTEPMAVHVPACGQATPNGGNESASAKANFSRERLTRTLADPFPLHHVGQPPQEVAGAGVALQSVDGADADLQNSPVSSSTLPNGAVSACPPNRSACLPPPHALDRLQEDAIPATARDVVPNPPSVRVDAEAVDDLFISGHTTTLPISGLLTVPLSRSEAPGATLFHRQCSALRTGEDSGALTEGSTALSSSSTKSIVPSDHMVAAAHGSLGDSNNAIRSSVLPASCTLQRGVGFGNTTSPLKTVTTPSQNGTMVRAHCEDLTIDVPLKVHDGGTLDTGQCDRYLQQLCPACFGGSLFGRSLDL
jgi:hypothetical protein